MKSRNQLLMLNVNPEMSEFDLVFYGWKLPFG